MTNQVLELGSGERQGDGAYGHERSCEIAMRVGDAPFNGGGWSCGGWHQTSSCHNINLCEALCAPQQLTDAPSQQGAA